MSAVDATEELPAALERGAAGPLGATADAGGVNFAVFSEHAESIELCIFDAGGARELRRFPLPARTGAVWHGHLAGARPGLVYGYRARGPYRPLEGHRFNPNKLLLDPYARRVVGQLHWCDEVLGYRPDHPDLDLSFSTADSAGAVPKACVIAKLPESAGPARPGIAPQDTVLYELHVRGYTMRHPRVAPSLRGTYAGLASDAVTGHLRGLGVTTVQLLPVHFHASERRLHRQGLRNFWGYNSLGYFCPHPGYASTGQATSPESEFRAMVRSLHEAGLEVVMDVVFNHSAESDELGPTLSFRGLDNLSYYRGSAGSARHYENLSGCGNTLNLSHPNVLGMVLDCLRYWAGTMEVDGFRFDLATALSRGRNGFDPAGAFFQALAQDPLLAQVKLIAEPWDCGPDGHQLGRFPPDWLEWNDHFRDGARGFWLRQDGRRDDLARCLTASADRFKSPGRSPWASVNYIAAHDGFTLADMVQYERRHNEANGEANRDGSPQELSCNCGEEGPSRDPRVLDRRRRLCRALLATLMLSQGTPMLMAGDESGRSQQGNNNAYCQDNELSWLNWNDANPDLAAFVAGLIRLRRTLGPLDPARWHPERFEPDQAAALHWLRPDGGPMQMEQWHGRDSGTFGFWVGAAQGAGAGTDVLVLFNAGSDAVDFSLPPGHWRPVLDSAVDGDGDGSGGVDAARPRDTYALGPHAVALLRKIDPAGRSPDEA